MNEEQTMVAAGLAALKPTEPLSSGRLTLLPLVSKRPGRARFVLAEKAIERGRLSVTEVSEAGSVPYLKAVNKGPWPVLIFDGEELVGAKQNRIVNTTILVGVGEAVLPVSCVEQGRWDRRSRDFAAGGWTSHPRLRREKDLHVRSALADSATEAHDPATEGRSAGERSQAERASRYRADQRAVWQEVALQSRDLGVDSRTGAMADAYRGRARDLDTILTRFCASEGGGEARSGGGPKPGGGLAAVPVKDMVGVAVFLDGTLLCLDILWSSRRFRELYPKLLRGYALEALRSPGIGEGPSVDPEAEVLRLFAGLAAERPSAQPGVDLGIDLRLETDSVRAAGLAHEGEMLQLSAFPR
jgi:hypothetical protein